MSFNSNLAIDPEFITNNLHSNITPNLMKYSSFYDLNEIIEAERYEIHQENITKPKYSLNFKIDQIVTFHCIHS